MRTRYGVFEAKDLGNESKRALLRLFITASRNFSDFTGLVSFFSMTCPFLSIASSIRSSRFGSKL